MTGTAQYVNCDLCKADDCEQVLEKDSLFYVMCQQCGFVYTNPVPCSAEVDSNVNFSAKIPKYVDAGYGNRKQKAYTQTLRKFSKYRKTNKLLEIGCNVGAFLYRARNRGWDPTGIEPAGACAKYARDTHQLNVISARLEDAGLLENTFDVVYSNAVFEHLLSPSSVVTEVTRVLRPGGIFYTKTVNWNSYTHEYMGADWQLLGPRGHLSLFTDLTLPRFCTDAGLDVIAVQSSGVRLPRNHPFGKLKKSILSPMSRITKKGDRIIVIARKPL